MDLRLINTESFESVCRTCMGKSSLISIFLPNKKYSLKFSEMLYQCAAVEANEGDSLPPHICKRCKTTLVALYKFTHRAKHCDEILRQILLDNRKQNDVKSEALETNPDLSSPPPAVVDEDIQEPLSIRSASFEVYPEDIIYEELEPRITKDLKTEEPIIDETGAVDKVHETCNDTLIKTSPKKKKKTGKKELKQKQMEKTNQCEACGKFLSCRSNLIQHMRRHTGEKPYSCDLCNKTFARAEHVTIHRRIHTGERPHSCKICQKRFVQYAALTAHLRTHSGERPHMCAICGKSFSQSVSLTYHTRTHTGETPFKCKTCNKGFAHSGNLNIHMRFHRNERPFACNICERRFVTSSHLTVHIKQHTGDRPHRCNLCGKAFARSEHLKDHLVIHTGQKPHACKLCPKRYTQGSHLNRHMKTHKS